MTIDIYKVEVGVLLEKNNEEYNDYSQVYDKQHAFYDENVVFFAEKIDAIDFAKKYVTDGVIDTYGIVKLIKYNAEELYGKPNNIYDVIHDCETIKYDMLQIIDEHILENWRDMFGSENFDMSNIVLSVMKSKDGSLVENFLITEKSESEPETANEQSKDYSHMLAGEKALFDMMQENGLEVIEVRDFGLKYQDMPVTHAIAMEHWKTHRPCVMLTNGNPADKDALYLDSSVQDKMGLTTSEFELLCNKIVELF